MMHQAKSQPSQDGLGAAAREGLGLPSLGRPADNPEDRLRRARTPAGLFGTCGARGLRGRCFLRHPGFSATAMVLLASSTRRSVSPQDADGDDCDDDDDGKETDHQAEVNNCDAVVGVLTIHLELRHS